MLQEPITATEDASTITYRAGTLDDLRAVHKVFRYTLSNLAYRKGIAETDTPPDDAELEANWTQHKALHEHLARTAEFFWVAEKDGAVVGYARTVNRGGLRELTEFFVLPVEQSGGVGRELLRRAFPAEGADHRCIIATIDARAQARYMKMGLYPRFPIYVLSRKPEQQPVPDALTVEPLTDSPEMQQQLAKIDTAVLGHTRAADHQWLLADRPGYLYRWNEKIIGYGYVGALSGPFALLDPQFYPAVLAHAETQSARSGQEEFGLNVPTVNTTVMAYLLERGFQIGPFLCLLMTDGPFGQLDHYIGTSPMLLL